MSDERLRCSRCRRPLLHPVMVAGMALGSDCARQVRTAAGTPPPSRRAIAEAAREAAFHERQIPLLELEPT